MVGTGGSDSEFPRPFAVDALGEEEAVQTLEAGPAECQAIARRLGLEALRSLRAELRIKRQGGGPLVRLTGRFEAALVQLCVVSLEPLEQETAEAFSQDFSLEPPSVEGDLELTLEDEDLPEEVRDGTIDLGEAVVQQLAVALDPYPRRPEAEVPPGLQAGREDEAANPFAALKVLKGGRQG